MDYQNELDRFLGPEEPLSDQEDLTELLYTISEMIGWPDSVNSVSPEQAMLCYKIVHTLKSKNLPDSLRIF